MVSETFPESRYVCVCPIAREHSLRCPLANRIQRLPLTPHILRIRLVHLVGMMEGSVSIASLVGVIIQQTRGLRLEREMLAYQGIQASRIRRRFNELRTTLASTSSAPANTTQPTSGDSWRLPPRHEEHIPILSGGASDRSDLETRCDRHEGLISPTIAGEVGPFPVDRSDG